MAYSGPIRGQVINARRVFSEDLDYETLAADASTRSNWDCK